MTAFLIYDAYRQVVDKGKVQERRKGGITNPSIFAFQVTHWKSEGLHDRRALLSGYKRFVGILTEARNSLSRKDYMKNRFHGFLLVCSLALPCLGQVSARPVLSAAPPAQNASQNKTGAPAKPGPSASNSLALSPEYRIGPYDTLQVTVWKETQLSGTFPVRPDGKISLVLLGDVAAAGVTPMELSATLTDMLKKYIQDPLVTVTVTAVNSQKVYVVGEVQKIGAIDMTPNMTPLEAIAAAGGLNSFSSGKHAYILRGEPGKQTKIPFDYKKALKGQPSQAIVLQTGDTVVIP